jgi:hypothetical protein
MRQKSILIQAHQKGREFSFKFQENFNLNLGKGTRKKRNNKRLHFIISESFYLELSFVIKPIIPRIFTSSLSTLPPTPPAGNNRF